MKNLMTLFLLAGFCTSVNASDIKTGDKLHSDNCTKCHDSSVYTRLNKRVKTLPKLGTQVRMCQNNLGISWFDDEVENVIGYLNKNYYHF